MVVRCIVMLVLAGVVGGVGSASHALEVARLEPSGRGADVPAVRAPGRVVPPDAAGTDVEEPTGPLQLRQALALALLKNPELAAFSWEVRAREAEVLQAGVRPNPRAALAVENIAWSGEFGTVDASETTIGVSQVFELGGKRANRRRVAEYARDLAAWDYETTRVDVLTEVTKGFVALLIAQEKAELVGELVVVAEHMLEAVARRVEAGGISPVEEGRAQVELETTRIDLQKAEREVAIAKQRLSATWGETIPRFSVAQGSIEPPDHTPTFDEIVERIGENPDLARWAAELARHEASVDLERSRRVPDLDIGLGFRRFAATDDNGLVAELALALPIFNRNRESERAAERRAAMAHEERRATSVRIGTRLATSYQELLLSENELTRLRDDVLPHAEATFTSAQVAYQRGRMRLTDVLDTQRTLFGLRTRYYDALGSYHQTRADIERLIGARLVGGKEQ